MLISDMCTTRCTYILLRYGSCIQVIGTEFVIRSITKESLVISRRLREFFLKLSQYKAFIDKGVSKFGIFLKSGIFNLTKNLQMTPLLIIFVDILRKIGALQCLTF